MSRITALITFDDSWDKETVLQIFEPGNSISQGIVGCEIIEGHCGKCAANPAEGQTHAANNARDEILAFINEAISLNECGQPADATVILRDLVLPRLSPVA